MVTKDAHLPVRFLIDKPTGAVEPWRFYSLPSHVLERLGTPYEVLEPGPLKIGTRIEKLIRASAILGNRCCSGCSRLQKLLDHVSEEWVILHRDEIAEQMQANAKDLIRLPIPQAAIGLLISLAIQAEETVLRNEHEEMIRKHAG